jgi:hypothetical protein
MLGCGWKGRGHFFEFWGRIKEGNAGVSCLFAICERGVPLFWNQLASFWFVISSLAWTFAVLFRAHRKSLLLLKRVVVCCGAKMAKGQLWHPFQMQQGEP